MIWRYLRKDVRRGRPVGNEPSRDGEESFALMIYYYLSGDQRYLYAALRNTYNVADLAVNHADFTMHFHNYWNMISVTYHRFRGLVLAYLETGDRYLLQTAEGVAHQFLSLHRSNWPRRTVGRGCYPVLGFLSLYDYTGDHRYLNFAREVLHDLAATQRPDGDMGQEAGIGLYGECNNVGGHWPTAGLNFEVMVEYLLRAGSDPVVEDMMRKVADWTVERQGEDGSWRGGYPLITAYVVKNLLCAGLLLREPRYFKAIKRTVRWFLAARQSFGTHAYTVLKNFPFYEAFIWGAQLTEDGVQLEPLPILAGVDTPSEVSTPWGKLILRLKNEGRGTIFSTSSEEDFLVRVVLPGSRVHIREGGIP